MTLATTPREKLEIQAARCRERFLRLDDDTRQAMIRRLAERDDKLARAWIAVLEDRHALATWLRSNAPLDALPERFPDGTDARRLLTSHPFAQVPPWSTPETSPGSSSTPRG